MTFIALYHLSLDSINSLISSQDKYTHGFLHMDRAVVRTKPVLGITFAVGSFEHKQMCFVYLSTVFIEINN